MEKLNKNFFEKSGKEKVSEETREAEVVQSKDTVKIVM